MAARAGGSAMPLPDGWRGGDDLASGYSAAADDGAHSELRREASMLFSVAEAHLLDEAFEESLRAAQDALTRFREVGDSVGIADTFRVVAHAAYDLAKLYFVKGLSEKWRTLLEETEAKMQAELRNFMDAGDKRGQASLMLSKGEVVQGWPGGRRLDEVLDYLLDSQDLAREIGDVKIEAKATLVRGKVLHRRHRFKSAAKAFGEAAALFKKAGDPRNEAQALFGRAASFDWLGSGEDEGRSRLKALKIVRDLGDMPRLEVPILLTIAEDGLTKSIDYQAAIAAARQAREICQSKGLSGWTVTAQCVIIHGLIRSREGKKAVQEAERAVMFTKEKDNPQDTITALESLIRAYVELEDYQEGLEIGQMAVGMFTSPGSELFQARALWSLASVYEACELFQKAEEKGMEALSLVEDMRGYEQIAFTYCQFIARVRVRKDDYEGAEDVMTLARRLAERADDPYNEGQALLGLAGTHMSQMNVDQAFRALDLARDRFKEEGYVKGEGMVLKSMAEYRHAIGEGKRAIALLEEGATVAEGGGYTDFATRMRITRAEFLQDMGNFPEASQNAMQALKQARAGTSRPLMCSALLNLLTVNAQIMEDITVEARQSKSFRQSLEKMMRYAKEALGIAVKAKLVNLEAWASYYVGRIYFQQGKLKEALQSTHSTIRLGREASEHVIEIAALYLEGVILVNQGELAKALEVLQSGVRLSRDIADGWGAELMQSEIDRLQGGDQAKGEAAQLVKERPQAGSASSASELEEFFAPDPAMVTKFVMDMVRMMTGVDDIPADSPLMESGIDSLSSVELRTRLQQEFRISLPATVMFNYPTVSGMSRLLVSECTQKKISWGAG